MIRVSAADELFDQAYTNARRALPVMELESPRQYGQRWRTEYQCRVDGGDEFPHHYYVFDRDADYTWFMLRWA
jgi:hypothetical protein